MKIGLIGCGTVGGTLYQWLNEYTRHDVFVKDPAKGFHDNLTEKKPEAIFISIPVNPGPKGQDQDNLILTAEYAKEITPHVFIRSTVLPGTNDKLKTYSMPEFLTARRAYEDFIKLPLVFGSAPHDLINAIFKNKIQVDKKYIHLSNIAAETAKYTHNLYGATKVLYFNIIKQYCDMHDIDFEQVKHAANITGFLGTEHMSVPGHDGKLGFGGTCFGPNLESFINSMGDDVFLKDEKEFFEKVRNINFSYRGAHA